MKIAITLDSTWWDRAPDVSVHYNLDKVWSGKITSLEKIEFDVDESSQGTGKISICLANKTVDQTVVDSDNNILKDQLLHIKNIEIDNIELNFLILSGIFYPQYPDHMKGQDLPTHMDKCNTIGFNGEWVLAFTLPFHIWFLENLP